jgi:hypothetical protein
VQVMAVGSGGPLQLPQLTAAMAELASRLACLLQGVPCGYIHPLLHQGFAGLPAASRPVLLHTGHACCLQQDCIFN